VRSLGKTDLTVLRNDKFKIEQLKKFDKILLSPGPGIPLEAGLMPDVVRTYASSKSILGVCLGHQCIGEIFGASLINMPQPVHGMGQITTITKSDEAIFKGIPQKFTTARYHSWLVSTNNLPDCIKITAIDDMGDIMALSHDKFDVKGVQFHPESVLTEHGEIIMRNWINS
jgi:anthranilate synthase component 2